MGSPERPITARLHRLALCRFCSLCCTTPVVLRKQVPKAAAFYRFQGRRIGGWTQAHGAEYSVHTVCTEYQDPRRSERARQDDGLSLRSTTLTSTFHRHVAIYRHMATEQPTEYHVLRTYKHLRYKHPTLPFGTGPQRRRRSCRPGGTDDARPERNLQPPLR